jgi:hypothetical protein
MKTDSSADRVALDEHYRQLRIAEIQLRRRQIEQSTGSWQPAEATSSDVNQLTHEQRGQPTQRKSDERR